MITIFAAIGVMATIISIGLILVSIPKEIAFFIITSLILAVIIFIRNQIAIIDREIDDEEKLQK